VIPELLGKLLSHKDFAKAGRAMQAMLTMNKIDIKALKAAAAPSRASTGKVLTKA
jgi:hypothetical protein